MPSRRDLIKMDEEELHAFLAGHKVVTCASMGPSGRPHLMPLWYVPDANELRAWTFAKSQKTKNLERDPRATLQVEDGVEYQKLRGVMMECDVEIETDTEKVADFGMAIFDRYTEGALGDEVREMVLGQAAKRVGLTFRPTRTVSWDHRKLGGTY
ncbi:MAG: pyridoxamine 5'-phosphate oxidase family protein [Thermoleophilaceae bacterium]|nr:pyridoxamine 5'-phosphate oxidase family protein [Thermoleophilaceae bacterium]